MSEMWAPRTARISDSGSASSSRPLKRRLPRAMRPGGCTRRMIDSAVTDLPLPDSPTSPSVSPARISKLTSSTAGTGPMGRSKTVVRFETESKDSDILGFRVKGATTEDTEEKYGGHGSFQ